MNIIQNFIYETECKYFTSYLNLMFDSVKRKEQEFEESIREWQAKISTEEEQADFDSFIESEAETLGIYRDLLFESFIILLYGYLEKQLEDLCNRFTRKYKKVLRLSDITGKGIERARIFMEKVCGWSLPEEVLWESISHLREIRNAIVHNGGIVKISNLKNFIESQDKEEIFCYSNGKLVLTQKYCHRAIDSVFTYLLKLEESKSS